MVYYAEYNVSHIRDMFSGYMQFTLSTSIVIMNSTILMKCYTLKIPN